MTFRTAPGHFVRSRGGFSLIEVLIAVVVLAFGLLGLAAVFPTVIRQQQQASDAIQGASIENSVEDFISMSGDLGQSSLPDSQNDGLPNGANSALWRGWNTLTCDLLWSADSSWSVPQSQAVTGMNGGLAIDPGTGDMGIGRPTPDPTNPGHFTQGVVLRTAERLLPRPRSGVGEPRHVWDIVARRVDAGLRHNTARQRTFRDDQVQVAVFVRRVDPAIRVPAGMSLSDLIAPAYGSTGNSARRVPVGGDQYGRPTLDGLGYSGQPNYSVPRTIAFLFHPRAEGGGVEQNRIMIPATTDGADLSPYASQLGQKLLDQKGVVHTVVKSDSPDAQSSGSSVLTVDPPFTAASNGETLPANALRVVFTPQIPAAVHVFTVSPK